MLPVSIAQAVDHSKIWILYKTISHQGKHIHVKAQDTFFQQNVKTQIQLVQRKNWKVFKLIILEAFSWKAVVVASLPSQMGSPPDEGITCHWAEPYN